MEVYLPRSARQHWVYGRHETSSQRMETEAPITMVMAIGDKTNNHKKCSARAEAQRYRNQISSLNLEQLLQLDVAVLDFMSFVDYGDGLSLPAEVGVARGCLGELVVEKCSVYGSIPNIPYRDQRTGFASEAKDTCDRVHGIDLFDVRASKSELRVMCDEMMGKLEGSPLLLCRSEDLNRVVGSWYWLQDNSAVENLPNIRVMLIEDFLVETLTRLHQLISQVPARGVPTFSQFTTLLTRSANDLNQQFRCEYHNTVEKAWDKAGCAKKNAMKYLGTISDCLSPVIADCRTKLRPAPAAMPPSVLAPAAARAENPATAPARIPAQIARVPPQSARSDRSDENSSLRPRSREGSVYSTGSSSSSSYYSTAESHLTGTNSPSQSSLNSPARSRRRGRGRGSHTSSSASSRSSATKKKDNPLGLLTPNDFSVPENPSSCSEDSVSTRSGSPCSTTPGVRTPPVSAALSAEISTSHSEHDSFTKLAPSAEIATARAEEDTSIPAPPRRPGNCSYSARKACSTSCFKKEGLSLPSSGVTNLPLRGSPAPAGQTLNLIGSTSTPEKGKDKDKEKDILPRKPRSFNKGKGGEKEKVAPNQRREETVSNRNPRRNDRNVPRSGTSTVPSDTVLVPASGTIAASAASTAASAAASTVLTTSAAFPDDKESNLDEIDAAFALESAAQSEPAAPPHPAFLLAFSAAESASQITPPPGFGPVPKHRVIPAGFAVAPLPNVRSRADLNESFSSEDTEISGHPAVKPAKKRGRN